MNEARIFILDKSPTGGDPVGYAVTGQSDSGNPGTSHLTSWNFIVFFGS